MPSAALTKGWVTTSLETEQLGDIYSLGTSGLSSVSWSEPLGSTLHQGPADGHQGLQQQRVAWAQVIPPISPFRTIQLSSVPSLAAGLTERGQGLGGQVRPLTAGSCPPAVPSPTRLLWHKEPHKCRHGDIKALT